MTTDGIALGTVMSEYLALTLVLIMLRRSLKRLSPGVYWPRLSSLRAYGAIFSVSFSLFLRTFVLLAGFAWFNRLSAQLGDTLLAANAMLLVFLTLISNTLDGSAAAAEAQVGMAVGQRQPKRLGAALWTTGWAAVALISALALFFAGLGGVIIQGLTSQPELAATALQYRYWVIALPLLGGIAFWLDCVFIGARRTADMRNGVIAGFAVFWLASHQWSHTNHGLWVSFLLLFATRSGWMLWIFWRHVLPMARLPHSRT
jgi:MATE family multidrug resistance protein